MYFSDIWLDGELVVRLLRYLGIIYCFLCDSADRPTVVTFVNLDLVHFPECCYRWCMWLHPNKTKALVVSRSSSFNSSQGDLVLSGVWCSHTVQPKPWDLLSEISEQAHFEADECGHSRAMRHTVNWYIESWVYTSVLLHPPYRCSGIPYFTKTSVVQLIGWSVANSHLLFL